MKQYHASVERADNNLPKLKHFQNGFEIDEVIAHRFKESGNDVLVRYKSQDVSENSWVPTDEVPLLLLQEYFTKLSKITILNPNMEHLQQNNSQNGERDN